MLRNYLRITLRNMRRHAGFTFINVTGLATGMAAFVLIVLFIQNERAYDAHNEHADDVYQVILDAAVAGQEIVTASSPAVMATQFQEEFPEIEAATRINSYSSDVLLTVDNTPYYQDHYFQADSSVFDVFTFTMLVGDPATALNRPGTMVLSETAAEKMFGNQDPMGQTVRYDNRTDYEVTGVYADLPVNSFFRPEVMTTFLSNSRWNDTIWLNNSYHTFIRLREGSNPNVLQAKFPGFMRTYVGPQIEQFTGSSYDDALASGMRYQWQLERLSEIYLYSKAADQLGPTGDIRYLYILGVIGLFVLAIAWLTVSYQSIRAATADPVKSLKYE
ncbi:MAG: ABC transporter permease [Bacteroidota bacterium]|nr:ABC transporter permease [Bacteroidota bacterium]